ncbi:DNA-binding response regulator [Paracoccus aestuarii]|uniref:DNA-binding response regulator n=1 Tax=Paracoccus aestuarii TaxID=453842 RepID=A0A418ZVN2_9RHOB|nr:response regulator transcription factor [Paracoccus aestuarii]RJL04029.1 DNA-binding response regulator [Paracoccus aestuarii]WCR01050.1 response regulator transcription factor [Paracoccus aestuarii]
MTPARILIVDDEAPIRRFLRVALEAEGHYVTEAATGRAGIEAAALTTPEAVILDLGLPDLDGREVLKRLREWSQVPVLILSVRADEAEKVALLDAGAQDYVTKPFGIGELLARLRGILRDRSASTPHGAVLQIADLTIDAATRTVGKNGAPIHLTRKEFDLLWLLASNAGRLVTQGAALEHIWGPAHREDSQYLRVFIRQLRTKIGDDAGDPRYIFTEAGVGYRFAST